MIRMWGLGFSRGKISRSSRSWNLWIMAMTRSGESVASNSLSSGDAVGDLHCLADALAGLVELLLQLGAVGDEDHLPVGKLDAGGAWRAP